MDDLYRQQYRISTIRLKSWDYTSPAFYFVTICTKNKTNYFGHIQNDQMILNQIGIIVQQQLMQISQIKKHILLDEHIIMPDHLHFILNVNPIINVETPLRGVSTTVVSKKTNPYWKTNCLGNIINQFKGKCTKLIKSIQPQFAWQTRYYEHIIKNDQDLKKIRNYIICNPSNWQNDRLQP